MVKIKKNILVVTGSLHSNSKTKYVVEKILTEFGSLDSEYSYKNIFLGDYSLNYCIGCAKCFEDGYCRLDSEDDMGNMREDLQVADIIIFASPVYGHNIPGIMKTFCDRLSYECHILNLSGKLGFSLSVTHSSGSESVNSYLDDIMCNLGIKVLGNYSFYNTDSVNESTLQIASDIKRKIQNNYGYSNYFLEDLFKTYKFEFRANDSDKDCNGMYLNNEVNFWNQKWVKDTHSFQEFAVKKRSIKNNFCTEYA